MKTLLTISFTILLSMASTVHAAAPATTPENECEGGSNMENAECVGTKLNIADQELNATVNAIRARLAAAAKTDREAPEVDRRLLKSQQAWAAFRQADCSLEGAEMLGGNGEGARIQSCELSKTLERLQQLSQIPF
ncbi:hypothetical protein BH10BDE1_BH10BDE1_09260 [soil metagenome]